MQRIEIMKQAAQVAGRYVLGAEVASDDNNDGDSTQKSMANDFVTVADIKSQDILRKELAKNFPDSVILSEEDSEDERKAMYKPDFTGFVLDPIDGTYNFKRGMQESAISIGYIEAGRPVAGVIYDPYKRELFEAELGKGSKCNGKSINVSGKDAIDGASVATSNGYNHVAAIRNLQRQVAVYEASDATPWTSCPGSAVLVLAWIAAGRVDAIHHTGFKPWDNAAGLLIVTEAGGVVQRLVGGEAKFIDNALLAGAPKIVEALNAIFSKLDPELLT